MSFYNQDDHTGLPQPPSPPCFQHLLQLAFLVFFGGRLTMDYVLDFTKEKSYVYPTTRILNISLLPLLLFHKMVG